MHDTPTPAFLLASHDPALLAALRPILLAAGGRVEIVLSAEAALPILTGPTPPALAVLDDSLPGMDLGRLLAAARDEPSVTPFPIVLISDSVTRQAQDRLADGVINDLMLRSAEPSYWELRIVQALRNHRLLREVETLREASMINAQLDRLTGVYNREAILATLFRETDRVQRMNSSLCVILLDLDDFGHWNSRLGAGVCDELLCQVAARINRLLRSYDVLGRPGKDEFLLVLPGCATSNAVMLAERLRVDVFCTPFQVAGEAVRLSACFGVANSQGRSPVVVLREAEQALQWARASGPESIQCFGDSLSSAPAPVTFLSPSSGDELLAW